MKKALKLVALSLVLVMMVATLASCGGPSGKYEALVAGTGVTMNFDGDEVTIAYLVVGQQIVSYDMTYEIEDDKITFSVPDDSVVTNEVIKALISTPLSYEEVDNGIKIAGATYVKAE